MRGGDRRIARTLDNGPTKLLLQGEISLVAVVDDAGPAHGGHGVDAPGKRSNHSFVATRRADSGAMGFDRQPELEQLLHLRGVGDVRDRSGDESNPISESISSPGRFPGQTIPVM